MTKDEVEQHFIADTKDHCMTIISADEDTVRRHLMFSENGSSVYRYDIHTWPGYLMVTGDMGTYVFSRIHDMFNFFQTGSPNFKINEGYWSEKLDAINSHCGADASIKEYLPEEFTKMIKEEFNQWIENWEIEPNNANEVWDALQNDVLDDVGDEQNDYNNAYSFESGNLNFYDAPFSNCREYNYHFRWILYAIVDGIAQYKASTKKIDTKVDL